MGAAVTGDNALTRQLWHIAGSGDLQQLDELVSQGADVNAGDRTGVTALMRAAYHGQLAMVRALIFYGADPTAKDRSGLTALMMANHGGHEEIIDALRASRAHGKTEVAQKPHLVAAVTEENVNVATEHEDRKSVDAATEHDDWKSVEAATEQNVDAATEHDDRESVDAATEQNVDVATEHDDWESVEAATEQNVDAATEHDDWEYVGAATEQNVSAATEHDDWEYVGAATEQNAGAATEHDDWEWGKDSQTARTLHEPPEIWEMVHTTQTESYSRSASPGRIFSPRILALALGALILCSGAVFGFLALRGAMSAAANTSDPRSGATAVKQTSSSDQRLSASKSLTNGPDNITRSANEPTKLKPVGKLIGERVDPPAISAVSSAKKLSVSQRPKATKVSATVPKQNKNAGRSTKLEGEQEATVKSTKKEPAPARDPVKPTTTQKPKVIQWP